MHPSAPARPAATNALGVDAEAAGRLSVIMDSSNDAIICKNLQGIILTWSRSAERIFGYRGAEIIGKSIALLIPRDRRLEEELILQRLSRGEKIEHYETIRRCKGGRPINALVSVSPIFDERGEVAGATKIVRDITPWRTAEQALRDSEARTTTIVRTLADAIITIDERSIIESANPAAESLFGYRESEIIGKKLNMLMPEPFTSNHDRYVRKYLKTGKGKIIGVGREVVGLRKDGSIFPMRLAVSEMRVGGRRMFTGIIHDLTLRRQLEREIVEASGNEQRRIGQDLHDGLCQQLAGVGFGVEILAKQLEGHSPKDAISARKLGVLVRDAITQARQLARGLNPVNLDRLGLAASVKDLADKVSDMCRVKCIMTTSGDIPMIGGNTATHLYRIAQEAVNNATRHGKATRIVIHLSEARGLLTMTVTDNGIGFPEDEELQSAGGTDLTTAQLPIAGMGLHSMSYRARLMSGSLTVGSGKRGGAILTCTVPLKNEP